MLITDEHEGYSYSIFGKLGKLAVSIQDYNGKDIIEKEDEEHFPTVIGAMCWIEVYIEGYIESNLCHRNKFLSHDQALEDFKAEILPLVYAKYDRDDAIAVREAFNNWTDSLCKDGQIDDTQYSQWDNPF